MTTSIYDSVQGKGLKFNTADDVKDVVDEINSLPDLYEIKLSGNTFGVEATRKIADALKTKDKIQVISFADIFTGRLKDEIPLSLEAFVDALEDKKQLTEVDLSDNAFGPTGAKPFRRLLINNRHIQVLKLNNTGLGIGGGELIGSALVESANGSKKDGIATKLETVVAGRNRLESPGAGHLASAFELFASSLRVIKMPQNSIRPEGAAALIKSLSKCPLLEHLDLQDNTFTEPGSNALAEALPSWPNLQILNVGDCLLGSKGGIAVIKALTPGSTKLNSLNLQFNEIDTEGSELIPAMLQNKTNLTFLELNGNEFDPEGDAVQAIRAALRSHDHEDALGELDEMEWEEEEEEEEEEEASEGEEKPEEDELDDLTKGVTSLKV